MAHPFVYSLGCLLMCVFTWSPLAVAGASRCPQLQHTIRTFRDKCYQFVSQEKYWDEADYYCKRNGGRLVSVKDRSTNSFIVNKLRYDLRWRNNGIWIGLHDRRVDGRWEWTTEDSGNHENVLWTNWGRGHPGSFFQGFRDCVRMVKADNYKWHETACHSMKWHYRFICQYRMRPTTITSTTTPSTTTATTTPATTPVPTTPKRELPSTAGNDDSFIRSTESQDFPETTGASQDFTIQPRVNAIDSESRKHVIMPHVGNEGDEHNPDVAAQRNENKSQGSGLLGGILALIGGLIICVGIVVMFLVYRRRKKNADNSTGNFDNPVYTGDSRAVVVDSDMQPVVTFPVHESEGLLETSCGEVRGACGGEGKPCDLKGAVVDLGKNGEPAPPVGPKQKKRAENDYVDSGDMRRGACALPPVPKAGKNPYLPEDCSGEVRDNQINHSMDDDYLSPKQMGSGYEIPKPPSPYMPMDGSPKTADIERQKKMLQYDTPREENVYAEIPDKRISIVDKEECVYESVA